MRRPLRLEADHQAIDGIGRGLLHLRGEVGVERGGLGARVAEIGLDEPEIDSGLEQMGGVGVAEGMHMSPFVDAAVQQGSMERGLEAGARDGTGARDRAVDDPATGVRGEEPARRAVGAPVLAQEREGRLGEWDVAVEVALAVDVEQASRTVDSA